MVDRELLIGRWLLAEDDLASFQQYGVHALHFTRHGDLVESAGGPGGRTRALLVWRLDGESVVTEQPSTSRTERLPVALVGERLALGGSWYARDDGPDPFDPDSRLYATGFTALRHAVASAGAGPFVPMLFFDDDKTLELHRIVAQTSQAAETAARVRASGAPAAVKWCAYTFDGFATIDGLKTDAAFAVVSERGRARAKTLVLRYRAGGEAPSAFGEVVALAESPTWLG